VTTLVPFPTISSAHITVLSDVYTSLNLVGIVQIDFDIFAKLIILTMHSSTEHNNDTYRGPYFREPVAFYVPIEIQNIWESTYSKNQ